MLIRTVLGAALSSAALAAGCGGSSNGEDVDPRAIATTAEPIVERRDLAVLAAAEHETIRRCMARAGFEYEPVSLTDARREARFVPTPYGFPSRAAAARAVTAPKVELLAESPAFDANDDYRRKLSPSRQAEYARAMFGTAGPGNGVSVKLPNGEERGVGVQGCAGGALKHIYGDVARWVQAAETAQYVRVQMQRDVRSADAYRRAQKQWKACMAERGLSVASEAKAAARARKADVAAQDRWIEAIWECHEQARIEQVVSRLERDRAHELGSEHEGQLLAYRELATSALKRAERVLAGQ